MRLPNGNTLVSNGYGAQIAIVNSKREIIRKFPDNPKASSLSFYNPNFFAGFQVLKNGNIVVANWQGHGPGHGNSGAQLLEFDSTGVLVSYWKQNASLVSSLHGVIVMDALDIEKMNSDINGVLGEINSTSISCPKFTKNLTFDYTANKPGNLIFNLAGKTLTNQIYYTNNSQMVINMNKEKNYLSIFLKR